jgi:large subunit ribosomal protein L17
MKHLIKKIKFNDGKDANSMLMKKLCYNFFQSGKLVTTQAKAKAMKSLLDILVAKSTEESESNKRYMQRYITDAKLRKALFEQVGKKAAGIQGGYVRLVREHIRRNDGSQMTRVEWAHDLSLDLKVKEEPKAAKKAPAKKAAQESLSPSGSKPKAKKEVTKEEAAK